MKRLRRLRTGTPEARELAVQGLDRLWALYTSPRDLVFHGPRDGGRRLALTFDDGPSAVNTPRVLDLLAEHDARGTFFVVGSRTEGLEEVLSRAAAEGHELANHTYSHLHTVHFTRTRLRDDLARASSVIDAATAGAARVRLVRPPFGKDRRRTVTLGRELGLVTALWSVDSGDAMGLGRDEIVASITAGAAPGAIVLMHDGGLERPATLGALETVLPRLRAQGYELVTLTELLAPPAR
jgi:peptidoglycan/xylan/chitin deacetylase (PgdA/CDA1 family)